MSEILLGVNIDHVATLRNARGTSWPDPVHAAYIAEQAGADSITIHLREDRRHIKDRDVYLLRQTIQTNMNLEMSITQNMLDIACDLKPNCCCLVPENRQEITTEGGLNVIEQQEKLNDAVNQLRKYDILVSIFLDANHAQINAAVKIGVSCIEIHTGVYANAINNVLRKAELLRIYNAVQYAQTQGLRVHAGHGLDYYNVKPIAAITDIKELNIGHSIISRSIIFGLDKAVKDMKNLIKRSKS